MRALAAAVTVGMAVRMMVVMGMHWPILHQKEPYEQKLKDILNQIVILNFYEGIQGPNPPHFPSKSFPVLY